MDGRYPPHTRSFYWNWRYFGWDGLGEMGVIGKVNGLGFFLDGEILVRCRGWARSGSRCQEVAGRIQKRRNEGKEREGSSEVT